MTVDQLDRHTRKRKRKRTMRATITTTVTTTKKTARQVSGFVFYEGASQIDGAPIVGICVFKRSKNKKTGGMVQTYILRSDTHPVDAAKNGKDLSICGNCQFRYGWVKWVDKKTGKIREGLKRRCYVNLGHGPTAVFGAYSRGSYPDISKKHLDKLKGRMLRLGTYGDPLAIPKQEWDRLLGAGIAGHTGYTHQWQNDLLSAPWIGQLMASCDNAADQQLAVSRGWKTFSVINSDQTHKELQSGMCPSSHEYQQKTGRKVQCEDCKLCNGSRASIAIQGHGIGWVDSPRISLL